MNVQPILLLLGAGFLVVNERVLIEYVRFLRRRRGALLIWPAPRPPQYSLSIGVGVALGIVFGCLIGYFAGDVAAFLEQVFRFQIFDSSVYVVTKLPSELRVGQVAWIAGIAALIALAGTIYPAYRASQVPPADALRYD